MTWTLVNTTHGVTRTLEAWDISTLQRSASNQGDDICDLTIVRRRSEASLQIACDDRVRIDRDGSPWFSGIVIQLSYPAAAGDEAVNLRLAGPWYFLQEFEFQQRWKLLQGGTPTWVYSPHVILNRVPAYTSGATSFQLATTQEMLCEILQYVLDQCADPAVNGIAAPYQFDSNPTTGTILPKVGLYIPVDEGMHLTAAECIRRVMRWHPDAVLWADHRTSPPTLHIGRHQDLQALTVRVLGPTDDPSTYAYPASDFNVSPAYDLLREHVIINYIVRGSYNDNDWMEVWPDKWPLTATGREMGALSASIDLVGNTVSFLKAEIGSTPFNSVSDPSDPDWWKKRLPAFNLPEISALAFDNIKVEILTDEELQIWTEVPASAPLIGYELISGQVADWMLDDNSQPATMMKVRVTAGCSYVISEATTASSKLLDQPIEWRFEYTNLASGLYAIQSTTTAGDPLPTISTETEMGVAKYLQQYLSVLRYRGSLTIVKPEVDGALSLGMAINIDGPYTNLWPNMKGLIQQINWQVATGAMQISFGTPEHFGLSDLVDHLRAFRDRRRWTNGLLQNSGQL